MTVIGVPSTVNHYPVVAAVLKDGGPDVVADLMHLCDALGLDWAEMCEKGRHHYLPELAGVL